MQKKVLYLITKSNFGGAQRYVFDLAKSFTNQYQTLVVAGGNGHLFELCKENNIPTISIDGLTRDIGLFSDVQAFVSILKMLRSEKPDVLHINSSKAGALGSVAARIAQVPHIVFTIHGLPQDEERSFISKHLISLVTWITCILSHTVICISHDNHERVRKWPLLTKRVHNVSLGIDSFQTLSRDAARDVLNLPTEAYVVGTIAELHRNKGLEYLIRACAQSTFELAIIGEGEERSSLEKLAAELECADRVHLYGFLVNARKYLKAFDVFCLPSVKEGLPYVLLEARSVGIPIVGSDLPGIREGIGNGKIIPPRDVKALAQTLPDTVVVVPEAIRTISDMSIDTQKVYELTLDR